MKIFIIKVFYTTVIVTRVHVMLPQQCNPCTNCKSAQ